MGMFDALFQESSVAPVKEIDYLAGLPIPTYGISENMSFVEAGTRAMTLVETEWLNITRGIKDELFVESLEESNMVSDTDDNTDPNAAKASDTKKNKIVAVLEKIKSLIMKAFQSIAGMINDFLNLVKQQVNKIGKFDLAKTLKAYNEMDKKPKMPAHFQFNDSDKGVGTFSVALNNVSRYVNAKYQNVVAAKSDALKNENAGQGMKDEIMVALFTKKEVESVPEAVSALYGKKVEEKESTEATVKDAINSVNAGFMAQTKAAKNLYKGVKKLCNEMAKNCDSIAKEIKKEQGADFEAKAKGAGAIGQAMSQASGLLGQYTGAYCQLLKNEFMAYWKFAFKCRYKKADKEDKKAEKKEENKEAKAEEKKETKANEATTVESSDSLFGFDLI